MNLLIGSIKNCGLDRVRIWAESALRFCKAKIVLIVLDESVPDDLYDLEDIGIQIVHKPTINNIDTNICKSDRHFYSREFLNELDNNSIVLLTDTMDLVFQNNPFDWYEKNAKDSLLLTSEGVNFEHSWWNMRGIEWSYNPLRNVMKDKDILNSGIIMGKSEIVKDLLLNIYLLSLNIKPEHTEGFDQPAMNVSLLSEYFKKNLRITTTSESFAVNCAIAGPTPQFESWGFKRSYKYDLPKITEDGIKNKNDELYCIVHQYNRVHEWNIFFNEKYPNRPRKIKNRKKIVANEDTAVVVCTRPDFSGFFDDWKKSFKFDDNDYLLSNVRLTDKVHIDKISPFVQDNVVHYLEENLKDSFNFNVEPSDKHWWNIGGGRNIVWFYPHLRMLYFYKIFPNYNYYWFFDDDVTFPNGQLYDFINQHKSLDHDCMISYIFTHETSTNNSNVPTMDENMVSYHSSNHNWLVHYPGPGDIHGEDVKEKYGSYFPLVRLSKKAMETLIEEHEKGLYGYSEGFVPTILNHRGLKLYSIFDKNSEVSVNPNLIVHHKRYHQMKWENL
jgi:hypothetical protein